MEPLPTYYYSNLYMFTNKGNKISKNVNLRGTAQIIIEGKAVMQSGVSIRGDLGTVNMGLYVTLREEVIIRPSYNKKKGKLRYEATMIGSNVYIDKGSVVQAASIGSNVIIGKNCIIGQRCILKDNCRIQDGSVLAPDTVVPPYTVFGGQPATYLGELPESTQQVHADFCKTYYKNFIGINPQENNP